MSGKTFRFVEVFGDFRRRGTSNVCSYLIFYTHDDKVVGRRTIISKDISQQPQAGAATGEQPQQQHKDRV